MKKPFIGLIIAVSVALVCVALFVWPTPYRYDKTKYGEHVFLVRTNRITGVTAILYPSYGWKVVQGKLINLPDRVIEKISGTAILSGDDGIFKMQLYNGTEYEIHEIDVEITLTRADTPIHTGKIKGGVPTATEAALEFLDARMRAKGFPKEKMTKGIPKDTEIEDFPERYRLKGNTISPFSTSGDYGNWSTKVDIVLNVGQDFEWTIISARGRRQN